MNTDGELRYSGNGKKSSEYTPYRLLGVAIVQRSIDDLRACFYFQKMMKSNRDFAMQYCKKYMDKEKRLFDRDTRQLKSLQKDMDECYKNIHLIELKATYKNALDMMLAENPNDKHSLMNVKERKRFTNYVPFINEIYAKENVNDNSDVKRILGKHMSTYEMKFINKIVKKYINKITYTERPFKTKISNILYKINEKQISIADHSKKQTYESAFTYVMSKCVGAQNDNENFLLSERAKLLCDLDGQYLIELCNRTVNDGTFVPRKDTKPYYFL